MKHFFTFLSILFICISSIVLSAVIFPDHAEQIIEFFLTLAEGVI